MGSWDGVLRLFVTLNFQVGEKVLPYLNLHHFIILLLLVAEHIPFMTLDTDWRRRETTRGQGPRDGLPVPGIVKAREKHPLKPAQGRQ